MPEPVDRLVVSTNGVVWIYFGGIKKIVYDSSTAKKIGDSVFGAVLCAYSPDGRRHVIRRLFADHELLVNDISEFPRQRLVLTLRMPGQPRGLAFSPDGHLLAAADDQGTVQVWDGTP